MSATIPQLIEAFPGLSKGDRSKLLKSYVKATEMSGDSFRRRIKAKKFPKWESEKMKPILQDLFPNGFNNENQI